MLFSHKNRTDFKNEGDVSQDGLRHSDILVWSDNYGASRLRCPPEDRQSTGEGYMHECGRLCIYLVLINLAAVRPPCLAFRTC